MRCKACNAPMNERRDSQGTYVDLCPACNRVSFIEELQVPNDIAAVIHKYGPQRDPADILAEALAEHDWGERLGLGLSKESVEAHLAERATEVYYDSLSIGRMPLEALEDALGSRKFRRNCIGDNLDTEQGVKSFVEEGNTLIPLEF